MRNKVSLKSISRGFGGDNAVYEGDGKEITVCVGWALLAPYVTCVIIDNKEVAKFDDQEYIQPHVALARLGYNVSGAVDFAKHTSIDDTLPRVSMVKVTRKKLMKIAKRIISVVLAKNKDYGDAWQRQGGAGWAVRLSDKLMRIENLSDGCEALVLDESIEDTLIDAIGYSLLGLLWLKENK